MTIFPKASLLPVLLMTASVPGVTNSPSNTEYTLHRTDSCIVVAGPSQRVSLRPGSSVTVDAGSIATNGQSLLIAGTPTHVWLSPSDRGAPPASDSAALGVIRDPDGSFRLVPPPPGKVELTHPRVASAGAAGWHFVFVAGKDGGTNPWSSVLKFDSADVWYGLFDGRAWRNLERITRTLGSSLVPGMSSDLVVTSDGLAFAYAFSRVRELQSNDRGNQGLVLLRRRGSRWLTDTLHTWDDPWAVQLTADAAGGVLALYAQVYFAAGRPHGPALFLARHDSVWADPRLLFEAEGGYVRAPLAIVLRSADTLVSWRTTIHGEEDAKIEWGILASEGPDGIMRQIGPTVPTDPWDKPAMIPLTDGRALWLVRNGESQTELRVFMANGSQVSDLGAIRVPISNGKPIGIPLPDGTALVVTIGLGGPDEPPASTYLTQPAVTCAAERK